MDYGQGAGIIVGSGDVILNNINKKRSKKWVWGLIGIFVVVVMGGLFAVYLINNGNENLQKKFNSMANYLLYTKNSSDNIGERDGKLYAFNETVIENNWDTDYFDKVYELYNSFSENVTDEKVGELGEIVSFFHAYIEFGPPDFDDIEQKYLELGDDGLKNYYRNKYEVFDMTSIIDSEYIDLFEVLLDESLRMWDDGLDYASTVAYPKRDIVRFLFSKSVKAEKLCFEIRDLIKEGKVKKDEKK